MGPTTEPWFTRRRINVVTIGIVLTSAATTAAAQATLIRAAAFGDPLPTDTSRTQAPATRGSAVPSGVGWGAGRSVAPETRRRGGTQGILPAVAEVQVAWWANRYSTAYREQFVRAVVRGQPYGQMIAAKLRNAGLPGALIYLPVVESRFSELATSRAGAVGLWQFMPQTARLYGLRVDTWVDERRDPYRETDAAVRYLHDLYVTFGDWYLALAAYNAGNTRVIRAVRASGAWGNARAFWAAQDKLSRETRDYVPQLLGVARVGANPAQYGIVVPHVSPTPTLIRVLVPPASRLTTLAAVWGISLDELARFNPALNWAVTPPDRAYAVVVPRADAEAKRDRFLSLPRTMRVVSLQEIARITQTH